MLILDVFLADFSILSHRRCKQQALRSLVLFPAFFRMPHLHRCPFEGELAAKFYKCLEFALFDITNIKICSRQW